MNNDKYIRNRVFLSAVALFMILINIDLRAQKLIDSVKMEADLYWDTKPKLSYESTSGLMLNGPEFNPLHKEDQVNYLMYREIYSRLLRDWGIEFWRRFPNDLRRFEWLSRNTLIFQPKYFKDIRMGAEGELNKNIIADIDTILYKRWNIQYEQFKKEFLRSAEISGNRKQWLLRREFSLSEILENYRRKSKNDKFDFEQYANRIIEYVKTFKSSYHIDFQNIYSFKNQLGLSTKDVINMNQVFLRSNLPNLQEIARRLQVLIELENRPFELAGTTAEGENINLEDYRGKIVLIDFWSPYCSACIAKMDEFKDVYNRYKSKGFQVISVCLFSDQKDELKLIQSIHKRVGADWPLVPLGIKNGQSGDKIVKMYGFQGVPQLLLLDETGKLVHYNGDMILTAGGLEKLLVMYLDK